MRQTNVIQADVWDCQNVVKGISYETEEEKNQDKFNASFYHSPSGILHSGPGYFIGNHIRSP